MPQQPKVYKAIISQSGADSTTATQPTVTPLENTIGAISFAKSLEQDNWIEATSNGLFTQGKTFLPHPSVDFEAAMGAVDFLQAGWVSSSKIVFAPHYTGTGAGGYLNGTAYIEIIVYP